MSVGCPDHIEFVSKLEALCRELEDRIFREELDFLRRMGGALQRGDLKPSCDWS